MKILWLAVLFSMISSGMVYSQETPPQRRFEEKGEQLMKEASQRLKAYRSLKIEFTYTMENKSQDFEESMAGVLFAQGDKYYMEVGDNLFVSDGETVWSYLEEMEELHINLAEYTEGGLTPTSVLEEFDQEFRSKFIRQESHEGKKVDIIDLLPNEPQAFFKYRVALDAKTKMLVYTMAYDRHGGTYTYSIDRFQPNIEIPSEKFSFSMEDYQDIEVIDLR